MKKVFLSGIAGTGMSALAGLFQESGWTVSGSDLHVYPPVDRILQDLKINFFSGFSESNIPSDVDAVVIGNVVSRGNPEAEYVLNKGLPYFSMAEALYRFFIKGRRSIVVVGTHGKTTTTAFVAHLLETTGLEPGFFIGGRSLNFATSSRLGRGDFFVSEGDEYETAFFDRSAKFLKYHPFYLLLGALEYDHADFFPSEALYLKAFQDVIDQVPGRGLIITNRDYEMNRQAVRKAIPSVISFGSGDADYRIEIEANREEQGVFRLTHDSQEWIFRMGIAGTYNAWNLSAGIVLGLQLGIPPAAIREAAETFRGVERRMQVIKRKEATVFIEDFAHHPTAIAAVLGNIKISYPERKVVAVFEPRSWSMRRNIFQERLSRSLKAADSILIMDIYQKEKIEPGKRLDIEKICQELKSEGKEVFFFDDYHVLQEKLLNLNFSEPQVVVLLSNGSFGSIPTAIRELK